MITDFDKKWTIQARRYLRLPALEEKLLAYFQATVRVFLPKDVLTLCETPNQLIEYFGYTQQVIRLPACDRNELKMKTNSRLKKRSTPLHYHLHNFVMSRIPTDIYKIRNPSLGLEQDPKTGNLVVINKQSKRLTEAVKFGFVRHGHASSSDRTPCNPKLEENKHAVRADGLKHIVATKDDFEEED